MLKGISKGSVNSGLTASETQDKIGESRARNPSPKAAVSGSLADLVTRIGHGGAQGQRPSAQTFLNSAKTAGENADRAQYQFRNAQQSLRTAQNAGERKESAGSMFAHSTDIVRHRNDELKNLSAFSVTADVKTPKDGAVFWSGDKLDPDGKVSASAMETAHAFADTHGGAALEQTPGGKQLDSYAGHPQSFDYLRNRFKYTAELDKNSAQSTREDLLMKGANRANTSIRDEMGPDLHDSLIKTDANGKAYTPPGRPGSAPGALWDTMSVRYARQAEGTANVIHAAPSTDPYFKSDVFANSTWMTKEKRTLQSGGKATFNERFGENLQGELEGPGKDVPDYTGTGGFKGNL